MANAKPAASQPYIKRLNLIGLSPVELPQGALVFVVGPNNGGKSTFLNEIQAKVGFVEGTKWIDRLEWDLGTIEQYRTFVHKSFSIPEDSRYLKDNRTGSNYNRDEIYGFYDRQIMHSGSFLVRLLNAESRITLANQVQAPDVLNKMELHPYHTFFYSADAELDFSKKMKAAFGRDFRVNRTGMQVIGHLGSAPKGDRLSVEYEQSVLTKMQRIDSFGDGVRSYAGILLNSSADALPVTIIDEPEAFLHPPQARRLGNELAAAAKDSSQQVFVATHSSDFIQGAMAAKNPNTFFLYLDHSNSKRPLFSIDRSIVEEFSRKPFLSHTNALDALFYEQAVICEGEADIMFFKWALEGTKTGKRLDEGFWISAYGKAAIPGILEDMHKLGVRARCVFDLDVLLSPEILSRVCATVGVDFGRYRTLLATVADGIKVPPAADALEKIGKIITSMDETADDEPSRLNAVREIKKSAESLGKSWALKSIGVGVLPKGQLYTSVLNFIVTMRSHGVVILEEGEIENYVPGIGRHGQAWVRAALEAGKLATAQKSTIVRQFESLT